MTKTLRWATALVLTAGLLAPATANADVPGPITTRVIDLLDDGGGTVGMYVKEIGGPVIAAQNETFPFEPASTIKVLLHLFAHEQVEAGNIALGDPVTLYSGASGSCPQNASDLGTESLASSLGKMMRVSDNPATRAQFELWSAAINGYATGTLGLGQTSFINYIGCDIGNQTVDDNTTSLVDLGIMYEGVADGSLLSGAPRDSFYNLMSGREQFEDFGFDFTGIWPKLVSMIGQEAPPGMPNSLLQDFRDGMTANHKGGGYGRCLDNACNSIQEWLSFAGWARFPTCENGAFSSRSYVWSEFIHGSVGSGNPTPAGTALGNAAAEPLREQMRAALATWGACYPPLVSVDTSPFAAPVGQGGWFNAADLAANGGAVKVNVAGSDDSGVTDLLCTDNGSPAAVGDQSGNHPRTGSFGASSDGTHAIECEATDGMTPANTGASDDSQNTVFFKIDGAAPALMCHAASFVLNGPGGDVSATVSDTTSGPLASPVSGPADVSSAGAKMIELTGEDVARNATTESCPYVVSYNVLGFFSPLPRESAKAGSTLPVKLALADANGVRIPDAEAMALAAACAVNVSFTGGTPSPSCASYDPLADRFQFELKTPKGATGPHTITAQVFEGAVELNSLSTNVTMK